MAVQLDRINSKFRQLTDLLFFSDKMDLDLSEFKSLLKENANTHYEYLWDRLKKCTEIFWENGEKFWSNRFSFLLNLNEKTLTKNLEEHLRKRMFNMVRSKSQVNIKYDIEYLQYVEFCKIQHARKESLAEIKDYLIDSLPEYSNVQKLLTVVNSFIPMIFADIKEYTEYLSRKIVHSPRNLVILLSLEENGLVLDRRALAKLARELLVDRHHGNKNCQAFFQIIRDPGVFNLLKQEYSSVYRPKVIDLLNACDYGLIEEHHLGNIKNLLELDTSIVDELLEIYASKLYNRPTGHKAANVDRLVRLAKAFPQITPKKILAYLSANNVKDIKYLLSSFPDLKKLAAFV